MCFVPQRRALFRHLNLQKWSGAGVFCTFWLRNVLRTTTACTFSTSQLPNVVRTWCALYILTSKCASRHNGVQFFISHLASWLRTRRFSEPTFRPSGATNHWKNTVFRDFPTFSRICIFFLLTLSLLLFFFLIFLFSLPLPCSAFHLSILSEVWLLNFLRLILIRHSIVMPRRGLTILPLHPFTLLLYSWRYQSEQTITNSIVVQIYFLVEYLDNIYSKVKYCYATDLRRRWLWGPPSQKIGKQKYLFRCVIIRLLPESTCKFLHPDIGKKSTFFFLNPRVQPLYSLSLSAEICTLT